MKMIHDHVEDLLINVYRTIVADDQSAVDIVWGKRARLGTDETDVILLEVTNLDALSAIIGSSDVEEILKQVSEDWTNS